MNALLLELAQIRSGELTPVFGLLIDTGIKGIFLIAAAAIVSQLLKDRSDAARHAAWTAAVIGHLALPVLTLMVPQWRIPLLPAPPWLDAAPAVSAPAISSPTTTTTRTSTTTDGSVDEPVAAITSVTPRVTSTNIEAPAKPIATISKWPPISI